MSHERNKSSSPVVPTIKVLGVLAAAAGIVVIVLMTIGFIVGPPQKPSAERITAECTARFAPQGQAAVDSCVVDLLQRAAAEENQRLLDDAYRASRRPE